MLETVGTFELKRNSDSVIISSGNLTQTVALQPFFMHSVAPLNYRTVADRWGFSPGVVGGSGTHGTLPEIDISGWSNTQWRSLLGIFSATYSEATWDIGPSATTTVAADYEWELS